MSNSNEPFVNLFDMAGILMIVVVIAAVLALLGSKTITWGVVVVLGLLFFGAIQIAKKGVDR